MNSVIKITDVATVRKLKLVLKINTVKNTEQYYRTSNYLAR